MKDFKDEKIGILTVLYNTGKTKYKKQSPVWMCECECGNQKEYSATELQCGTKSCGCLRQKNLDTFGDRWKGVEPPRTKPPGESTKRAIYSTYVNSANKRGIDFQLNESHFKELIAQNCLYCGAEPSQVKKDRRRKSGDVKYNGVDRQNNDIGYTEENCVPCCKICNRAKDIMSVSEFLSWAKKVGKRCS